MRNTEANKIYMKWYREVYPDRVKASRKRRAHKARLEQKKYVEDHHERMLVYYTRKNAKQRGIPHLLSEKDIIIPDLCPILGVKFERGNARYAPSIDRIDNSKGYTPDNIQIITRKANTMKSDASTEELRSFARWILSNV